MSVLPGVERDENNALKCSKADLESKQITFDEFLPVLAQVSEMPTTGTKEDFLEGMKVFDKEGNGYVLAVEIQHVLASLGESLKQEEVDEIFKGVEVNSQGAMKYEAFVEHFMADPADEEKKKFLQARHASVCCKCVNATRIVPANRYSSLRSF